MINVLSALKEHIYNKYLNMSIVQIVHQAVQGAPISTHVHNASSHTTGEHTVRTTVSIALVIVIKMTVAPKDVLKDITRPKTYQKVGMNATSALPHVLLARICRTVRNVKTGSTAKQTLYVLNVPVIVEMGCFAISPVDIVRTVVVMVGLETDVISPVHLVALHASNIIPDHVACAAQACMEINVKNIAVQIAKQ